MGENSKNFPNHFWHLPLLPNHILYRHITLPAYQNLPTLSSNNPTAYLRWGDLFLTNTYIISVGICYWKVSENRPTLAQTIIIKNLRYYTQTVRCAMSVCWNLVNCCRAVRKIASERACSTWMTLKVTQGYLNCLYSMGHTSLPISGLQQHLHLVRFPRYYHIYSERDWLSHWEILHFRKELK